MYCSFVLQDALADLQDCIAHSANNCEPFKLRMAISSPALRSWLGVSTNDEVWHEVSITRLPDPVTRAPVLCVAQVRPVTTHLPPPATG